MQIGAIATPIIFKKNIEPYFGFDWKLRSAEEGKLLTLTAGLLWKSKEGASPIRFAAHYMKGRDPRGQFFGDNIKKFSYGIELDL